MFPLALIRAFPVPDGLAASTHAFAAAGSLAIDPTAASIAKRRGARLLLRLGYATRTPAIAIMTVAFSRMGRAPLALAGFALLVLAWPVPGVSHGTRRAMRTRREG